MRPVTVVQKLLVSAAPPECLTRQQDEDTTKRKVESIIKSTSQSLMVRPATPRVWARPSIDGLEVSPITGIIMRTSTSWLRLLEL